MDFSNFLVMKEELSLIVVMVALLVADLFMPERTKRHFHWFACALFAIHTVINAFPGIATEAFGGMYQYTPMMTAIKTVINIGTLIVFLQAHEWLKHEDQQSKQGEFYFLTLATLLGMYFMISAGHFLLFYIGLETASIPMATLIAFHKKENISAEAGAKFILNAAFASGLSLFGLSLLYGTIGNLYFADFAQALAYTPLQVMAMFFFSVGLLFKLSVVPFHLWTADVYQGAPTTITSYLSVVSKGAAAFVAFTLFVKVFATLSLSWQPVFFALIVLTITIGNLFAIRQKNIKRFMAYSSISQAGYLLLGVMAASTAGLTTMVYFSLVYVLANLAVFGVIGVVERQSGKLQIDDYNGFYQTNPRLSFVMMLALFSLAGIPPLAGFFSKYFIFAAAAQQGHYVLVFIALLNTIISLYYYLLIVKAMFITPNDQPLPKLKTDAYGKIAFVICLLGMLLVGLISQVYQSISALS